MCSIVSWITSLLHSERSYNLHTWFFNLSLFVNWNPRCLCILLLLFSKTSTNVPYGRCDVYFGLLPSVMPQPCQIWGVMAVFTSLCFLLFSDALAKCRLKSSRMGPCPELLSQSIDETSYDIQRVLQTVTKFLNCTSQYYVVTNYCARRYYVRASFQLFFTISGIVLFVRHSNQMMFYRTKGAVLQTVPRIFSNSSIQFIFAQIFYF